MRPFLRRVVLSIAGSSKENVQLSGVAGGSRCRSRAAAARVEADRIRKAGRAQAAQANASLAASGVDTGEGTALRIQSGIVGDAEQDAYQTILNGTNQGARLNAQASADRISGRNASTSGYISAGSSLLSAGGTAYNGWKKAGSK